MGIQFKSKAQAADTGKPSPEEVEDTGAQAAASLPSDPDLDDAPFPDAVPAKNSAAEAAEKKQAAVKKSVAKKAPKKKVPAPVEDETDTDPVGTQAAEDAVAADADYPAGKNGSVTAITSTTTTTQPQAIVTVEHKGEEPVQKQEPVGEPLTLVAAEPMANVGLQVGMTHALPNYSNVKFSVSLHMPSKTDPASLAETFETVKDWIDERMQGLVAELTSEDE